MNEFAKLYDELDSTTSTLEKIAALRKYFSASSASDAMWAVLILTGRTVKRNITSRNLRQMFILSTGYPEWLYEESRHHVGDTAETISLLLQTEGLTGKAQVQRSLTEWLEVEIPKLSKIENDVERAQYLLSLWNNLDALEIFLLSKLMTGSFRVGVSEKLIIRALSEVYDVPTDQLAHRLTGAKTPGEESFRALVSKETEELLPSQPYPFCLAHSWSEKVEKTWLPQDYIAEWKYDGIRAQVILRDHKVWIWSRGEEEITSSFPDIVEAFKDFAEGVVLDGEIIVIKEKKIALFQDLQKRLGRKKVSAPTLKSYPAGFIAYDILEHEGKDIRPLPLKERKQTLKNLFDHKQTDRLFVSQVLEIPQLEDLKNFRARARGEHAEGLMIKSAHSPYVVGRKTGAWWKYKVDPLTLDAVLLYAQAGTGRRANLYTDYTFALWNGEELVPFAKAYSGLDQKEIDQLDHWIRRHTKEKFGPVRSLEAKHVFEIGFEGISESNRHKSGIAVRFPRILRWRKDKTVADADTLSNAKLLLENRQ